MKKDKETRMDVDGMKVRLLSVYVLIFFLDFKTIQMYYLLNKKNKPKQNKNFKIKNPCEDTLSI